MLLPFLLATAGCTFQESLPQVDIAGTVVVPRDAATLDGETDARFIGPVFLGAFPGLDLTLQDYPHPEVGPIIDRDLGGNTYPYGGGTVGRFDFACFESIKCQVATGRFKDYGDILEFFADYVGQPVTDEFGAVVDNADYFRDYCYNLFEVTADYELLFISGDDGIDFTENADGDFEAEFDMWQVTYKQDMTLWGFVDSPSSRFGFSTCNPDDGQQNVEYVSDFTYGASYTDILNYPSKYVGEGDYTSSEAYVLTAEDADAFRESGEQPVLALDFLVEEN